MKKIILVVLASLFMLPSNAQGPLNGQIMNQKQNPLKGIKVWRKNTTESVITDKMGMFGFSSLSPNDTLVIFVTKREEAIIPVKKMNTIAIKIEKKFFLLFDGEKETKYNYKKSPRLSFNSNVITQEQIVRMSANSIYDLFKGEVPGVTVKDGPSGRMIAIRGGANSLELDTEPLFVVNGTQYETSSEVDQAISMSDVEKVEVLKEGSGYGIRGANGVIIITMLKR